MNTMNQSFTLQVETTDRNCPIGETTAKQMMAREEIPVISCEGACIRGEIARLAANLLAKQEGYGRGCHGEILTVPESSMAKWARISKKIVVIDGCFLHCHGRIMKNSFNEENLHIFDAHSFYGKYSDIMDIDGVPEPERKETARIVMNQVLSAMEQGSSLPCSELMENCGSCCSK